MAPDGGNREDDSGTEASILGIGTWEKDSYHFQAQQGDSMVIRGIDLNSVRIVELSTVDNFRQRLAPNSPR